MTTSNSGGGRPRPSPVGPRGRPAGSTAASSKISAAGSAKKNSGQRTLDRFFTPLKQQQQQQKPTPASPFPNSGIVPLIPAANATTPAQQTPKEAVQSSRLQSPVVPAAKRSAPLSDDEDKENGLPVVSPAAESISVPQEVEGEPAALLPEDDQQPAKKRKMNVLQDITSEFVVSSTEAEAGGNEMVLDKVADVQKCQEFAEEGTCAVDETKHDNMTVTNDASPDVLEASAVSTPSKIVALHAVTPVTSTKDQTACIKNGRAAFQEKKFSLEQDTNTLQELCKFREYRATLQQPSTMTEFPKEFYPLLGKLVQDSDASISVLSSKIRNLLCPNGILDETTVDIPQKLIAAAIQEVAERINYGIQENTSNALSIWRWEVKDLDWLPANIGPVIHQRRERRIQARECLVAEFAAMSEEERQQLSTVKRGRKSNAITVDQTPSKEGTPSATNQQSLAEKQRMKEEKEAEKQALREQKEAEKQAMKEEKEAKRRQEKEKKEQEKQEILAAKEAAKAEKLELKRLAHLQKEHERLRKEEEKVKAEQAQTRISGFFTAIKKDIQEAETGSMADRTDFEQAFPQFHVKQFVLMAPIRSANAKYTENFSEDILNPIDTDLNSLLKDLKQSGFAKGQKRGHVSEEIFQQIQQTTVKLLQFGENYRPAFYGTWARTTKKITGRRPLALDNETFDYEVDSEEEWEEEEEGDECLSEDEEDEEEELDMQQDDDDPWLVPHGYLSDDEGVADEDDESHGGNSAPATPQKRPVVVAMEENKPRKKLEFLQPIVLTSSLLGGDADFPQMRVHLFLEASFPLDPFMALPTAAETKASVEGDGEKKSAAGRPKKEFPVQCLKALMEMMEGSSTGVDKLIEELKSRFPDESISKHSIAQTIKEIGTKQKNATGKSVWHIQPAAKEKVRDVGMVENGSKDVDVQKKEASAPLTEVPVEIAQLATPQQQAADVDISMTEA